jgi:large subunit ribosomal protein L7/L12
LCFVDEYEKVRLALSLSKEEKRAQVNELHEKFKAATVSILTHYSGLNVTDMMELRRRLRSVNAELRVVKNTLAARAVEGTSLDHARADFQGPIAVALGYADPVAPTKIVKEFSDNNEQFRIKLGIIEGRVMDSANIRFVAQLPEKEVLLAKLVSQIQAPLVELTGIFQGILYQFVGTIEAIQEKKKSTTA